MLTKHTTERLFEYSYISSESEPPQRAATIATPLLATLPARWVTRQLVSPLASSILIVLLVYSC